VTSTLPQIAAMSSRGRPRGRGGDQVDQAIEHLWTTTNQFTVSAQFAGERIDPDIGEAVNHGHHATRLARAT
jgi:hypothetical protein